MPTKAELQEYAAAVGIEPDGLTKDQLEEALREKGWGGDPPSDQGMDGQSEPYYPQQRRHENQ